MLNAPLLAAAIDAFKISDLRHKLLFTLGMLVASRFIAHLPIPGADLTALQRIFQTNQLGRFFDLFSGGALSSLSVAALGVYPYITAQIIMQIMQQGHSATAGDRQRGRERSAEAQPVDALVDRSASYGAGLRHAQSDQLQHRWRCAHHQEFRLRPGSTRHAGHRHLDDGWHDAVGVDG